MCLFDAAFAALTLCLTLMDPVTGFSAAAAAIGLFGQAVTLVNYVREVKAAIDTIDEDVEELIKDLEALEEVQGQLKDECSRQSQRSSVARPQQGSWSYVEKTMRLIQESLKKFTTELEGVYGANPKRQGLRDALKKQHRLRGKASKFQAWRVSISQQNGVIQTLLQMILVVNQSVWPSSFPSVADRASGIIFRKRIPNKPRPCDRV